MSDAILFRAVWAIKPGKLDEAKRYAKEFAKAMQNGQPGTRMVGVYVTPDGKSLIVHELHENPEATLAHLKGTVAAAFMPKFMEVADAPAFEVYGNLTSEIEGMLKPFQPVVHGLAAGYLR